MRDWLWILCVLLCLVLSYLIFGLPRDPILLILIVIGSVIGSWFIAKEIDKKWKKKKK